MNVSRLCPNFSVLRHRKLLFVSAVKQIAAQWFPLTSKIPLLAVIVISKPELHYLALPSWSPQIDYSHRFLLLLMLYFWSVVDFLKKSLFCTRCRFCSKSMFVIYDVNWQMTLRDFLLPRSQSTKQRKRICVWVHPCVNVCTLIQFCSLYMVLGHHELPEQLQCSLAKIHRLSGTVLERWTPLFQKELSLWLVLFETVLLSLVTPNLP